MARKRKADKAPARRARARPRKPATQDPAPDKQTTADRERETLSTIADVAQAMGVARRTAAGWLTDPSFPGKAGSPGKGDGHFPLAEIRAWHLATHGTAKAAADDAELLAARRHKAITDADRAHVALEREIGSIADAEEVAAFLARVVASAKSALEDAADRAESRLPRGISTAAKKAIRAAIEDSHRQALDGLAELLAGDQDEADEMT